MTKFSNLKNNDKHTIQVQIQNIDWSRTIKVQVQNIHSNLTLIPTGQKSSKKKLLGRKKSEELFAAFRNVIGYGFQEPNEIIALDKKILFIKKIK